MRLKEYVAAEVEFTMRIEPEDIPIKGQFASGDDAQDDETERWILSELKRGNDAAWCCLIVEARADGFLGRASLGCCSYASEAELLADEGEQLKAEALADLNHTFVEMTRKIVFLVVGDPR